MNNSNLNVETSFKIINEMIQITRQKFIDDGFHFLLWGTLIILACLTQFVMIHFLEKNHASNLVWLIMPIIGVPISIFYGSKKHKSENNSNIKSNIYLFLWKGFGISLFLIILISSIYKHTPTAFIMVVMGFAVYLSGSILKFNPLKIGSLCFWIGAIIFPFINYNAYQVLFYGAIVFLGYLVPGILLWNQFKKDKNV
jgi:hypothetical protein